MYVDMGTIVVHEVGQHRVHEGSVAGKLSGQGALHELAHAVANHKPVLRRIVQGQGAQGERMVHRHTEVFYGVEQCPVKVKNDKFEFHGAKIENNLVIFLLFHIFAVPMGY